MAYDINQMEAPRRVRIIAGKPPEVAAFAKMLIHCLVGDHWPRAAFHPASDGPAASRCADCGVPMVKRARSDWRPLADPVVWTARRLLRMLKTHAQPRQSSTTRRPFGMGQ